MESSPQQDGKPSPPWIWAAMVAFALVAVTAGAIVGMVATDGSGGGSPKTIAATATTDAEPAAPATVPVLPATEFTTSDFLSTDVTDTGIGGTIPADTGAIETIPALPSPSAAGLTEWPPGTQGFTVVLASVAEAQGEAAAQSVAQQAIASGLPSVGVLRSADFQSLRPGFWVVFSGVYASLADAAAAVAPARSSGFPTAYPRAVEP